MMFKNKMKHTVPTRDEVKQMLSYLSEIVPATKEEIIYLAVYRYYRKHKSKLESKHTDLRSYLLIEQQNECYYCHKWISHREVTLDHKQPRGREGTEDAENLCACCAVCNSLKGNMNEKEFVEFLKKPEPSVSALFQPNTAV